MNIWLVVGLVMIGGMASAWADVTVIYRKSDRVVANYVYPPHSVDVEVRNIIRGPLGGVASDYATVVVPDAQWAQKQGQDVTVNPGGQVVFAPNPELQQFNARRASGKAKLVAGQPLTMAEVDALFP